MNPSVLVNVDDFKAFKSGGKHAQTAFPYLTGDEREYLISGVCIPCWTRMEEAEDEE
jgi:hypothetical protein